MTTEYIIVLLSTGIVAGFVSGLLGVGGAFIMVPVQYWVYTAMGFPPDIAARVAFGTSLLVIFPTAASGVWGHSRRGAVWWRAGIVLGLCGMVGAFIGAGLAAHLPGTALKIAFGVIVLTTGIVMLTSRPPRTDEQPRSSPWLWIAWGIPTGIVSGALGMGGGPFMVPIMTLVLKFPLHRAVATSMVVVMFSSIGGFIGYIMNGLGVSGLPPHSIGYVNIPTWFLLAVTSIGMAQVGARVAHRLPARQLKWIFTALMFYIGLRMIGVFDWLGWPV